MRRNIGTTDRMIRILVAVALAVLYFTKVISGTPGFVLLILAGILFITALVGTCPLYLPLKLSTRKVQK